MIKLPPFSNLYFSWGAETHLFRLFIATESMYFYYDESTLIDVHFLMSSKLSHVMFNTF